MTEAMFLFSPNTGTIEYIDREAVLVEVPEDLLNSVDDPNGLIRDAADNPMLTIIPVLESMEHLAGMDDPEPPADIKIAGFLDKQEDVVLPAAAVWYVRSMIARGVKQLEDSIEECVKLAATTDENVPEWAKDQVRSAANYNKQMLNEAKQYIPDAFLV